MHISSKQRIVVKKQVILSEISNTEPYSYQLITFIITIYTNDHQHQHRLFIQKTTLLLVANTYRNVLSNFYACYFAPLIFNILTAYPYTKNG